MTMHFNFMNITRERDTHTEREIGREEEREIERDREIQTINCTDEIEVT